GLLFGFLVVNLHTMEEFYTYIIQSELNGSKNTFATLFTKKPENIKFSGFFIENSTSKKSNKLKIKT
ncbi:MAG: hypothetical protein JXL97_06345, partial [Bacteroidales bacterium]|nr:hypothetical protein [Bacteroidales bacterium]